MSDASPRFPVGQPLSPPARSEARDVAQASSPASSSTVPVPESDSPTSRAPDAGGETPPQPAAGTAALPHPPDPLLSGFHFRGVLPHLKREGGTYFVTFRQAGTLPQSVLLRFKQERDVILRQATAAKRPLNWHEQEELFQRQPFHLLFRGGFATICRNICITA